MVFPASLLLATCVGCPTSSTQVPQLPAVPPQPETAPLLKVSAQQLTPTQRQQFVTPDAPIAVEWSARSRESSLGTVLKLGSRGTLVTRLQVRLARLGYAVDKIDGVFGPQTQATVMQFQQAYGLAPDGIVETSIWAKLNHDITHSGQIQPSQPIQPIANVATPAPPSPSTPSTSPTVSYPVLASSADSLFSEKAGWIVVLVVLQGAGWLVILQGLNKELALVTGRSLFPGKTGQWLFSVKQ